MLELLRDKTWREVARGWREDEAFRAFFSRRLANVPHDAFVWETIPHAAATQDRPYRDIAIHSPELARVAANPAPFADHFTSSEEGICTFTNLGGDAILVAPSPGPDDEAYPHIAAFLRTAPAAQVHALWIAVGRALEARLADRASAVWVSTAGLGVHWLHVRLDDRPKYYRHAPFR